MTGTSKSVTQTWARPACFVICNTGVFGNGLEVSIWDDSASRRLCSGTCQRFLEAWSKAIQALSFSAFAFSILNRQTHSEPAIQMGVQDLLALVEAPFVTSESELSQSSVFLTPGLLSKCLPVLPRCSMPQTETALWLWAPTS